MEQTEKSKKLFLSPLQIPQADEASWESDIDYDLPKYLNSALISRILSAFSITGVADEGHVHPHRHTPGFSVSQVGRNVHL